MAKQPRLHEVSKALGLSSKVLMTDLSAAGFEFKTHMATLDDAAVAVIRKKYPKLDEALKQAAAEAASEAPKPKAPKAKSKSSKMVTSRTVAKKKSDSSTATEPEADPSAVELVRQESGETVEQKKIAGGIIRRRRVEDTPVKEEAPAPQAKIPEVPVATPVAPVEQKVQPASDETSVAIKESPVETPAASPIAPVAPAAEAKSAPAKPVETSKIRRAPAFEPPPVKPKVMSPNYTAHKTSNAPAAPAATPSGDAGSRPAASTTAPSERRDQKIEVPVPPPTPRGAMRGHVAPTGRNLSAGSRLKIVEQTKPDFAGPKIVGTAPLPPPRPDAGRKGKVQSPEEIEEAAKAAAKPGAAAADRKGAKNWEAPRVTKRDLIGMTEEFEISRPSGGRKGGRKSSAPRVEKKTRLTTPNQGKRKIRIEHEIRVADLADRMAIKAADVVRKLISMGQMMTAQQNIDFDTAVLIASEYDYEVENVAETAESVLDAFLLTKDVGEAKLRAPVVTIMGHVDHGKTSLLDTIRKTEVAAGEAGGITQHIGAYQVHRGDKLITFLDTPGHQAFTKMRARGASVTDLVILVVAADEGVKAQTQEAIAHAKAAKVPIIVAVNKMDKPDAAPDRVMQELAGLELVPEEWGGDTMYVKVSAKQGTGVEDLLDRILVQAEVLELKAAYEGPARGTILESRLDKGKGPVASLLVTQGSLEVGDTIVAGHAFGRVRAMFNDRGQMVKEATPSMPVEVLGLASVPDSGEIMVEVEDESIAKQIADLSAAKKAEEARRSGRVSLEDMYKKMQTGDVSELRVILKGDVHGSIEAIADALEKIKHEEVRVSLIYKGAGGITESDVSLAAASGAIILGFNVRPAGQAKAMAAQEGIQIKTYSIIYELIDEVKLAMQGLLAPEYKENQVATVEVRDVFTLSKFGVVAGCFVKSGKVTRGAPARLVRDSVVIYDSKIQSLRRFKDDAKEVAEGFECGLKLENFTDIKVGDIIEVYEKVEIAKAVM